MQGASTGKVHVQNVLVLPLSSLNPGWEDLACGEWADARGPAPRFPWERLRKPVRAQQSMPSEREADQIEEERGHPGGAEMADRQRARRVAFNRAVIAARWESRPRGAREVWRAERGL